VLIVVGGLPGTGKTTLARAVVPRIGAVHLRIDIIEQAILEAGVGRHQLGPAGYSVGYALAADLLDQQHSVIADSVNALAVTRAGWRAVARRAGIGLVEVEIVCTDLTEHRHRAATRVADIAGLRQPTWKEVTDREYLPWDRPHPVIDTAGRTVEDCTTELLAILARSPDLPAIQQ
jgi:predicted kinase